MTRNCVSAFFTALLLLASNGAVGAQTTVTVSGNPALLRISSAIAGSEPTAVSNAVTTYTVDTPPSPNTKYQVTAQLNANMPVGTTLTATFAAVPSSTTSGAVALDVTARQVVFNIRKNFTGTAGITYQFAATTAAGVVPLTTRIVTLTIITYP